MKKIILFLILPTILILFAGCGKKDSPEEALSEIQTAFSERDIEKFSERIDTENFFSQVYDDATIELAKNCEVYGKKYPKDPYFQHDGEFLKKYNAEHKELHLKFLDNVIKSYFAKMPEPDKPEENPYAYVANEFEKIRNASLFKVTDAKVDENNHATITAEVAGDNSIRGMFIGKLTFKLGFDKNENGKWRLTKIENIDELTPSVVDKAEMIWITFF